MPEVFFTDALFVFLSELALHNDRDWFARNRERYLRDVRDPMLRFVAALKPDLARIAPRLVVDARPVGGSLFRIQRDTRFAADKSPYKTNVAAHFRHEAGRDVHGPGLYLSLAPGEVEVGGGIWHPEPAPLLAIRRSLVERTAAWKRVLAAPAMQGLEWWGASLKRTPRGFPEGHPLDELLRRKDFGAGVTLGERDARSPHFKARCLEAYRALVPTLKVLAGAVGVPW